jgi:hypothetical protein
MLLSLPGHCSEIKQLDSVRLVSYTFTTENLGRHLTVFRLSGGDYSLTALE